MWLRSGTSWLFPYVEGRWLWKLQVPTECEILFRYESSGQELAQRSVRGNLERVFIPKARRMQTKNAGGNRSRWGTYCWSMYLMKSALLLSFQAISWECIVVSERFLDSVWSVDSISRLSVIIGKHAVEIWTLNSIFRNHAKPYATAYLLGPRPDRIATRELGADTPSRDFRSRRGSRPSQKNAAVN